MTTLGKLVLAAIVVVAAAVAWVLFGMSHGQALLPQPEQGATTTSSTIIPGVADQMYVNKNLSFSITYPASATSSPADTGGYLPLTQTTLTSFVLPSSMYAGTNLEEAGVYVGASSSPAVLASCTSPQQGETLYRETINGADFAVATSGGAGAGNFYDMKSYRRIENGWCVELVEVLHSGNIGNYTPGSVVEFDLGRFSGILDAIVHTYRSIPTGI